MAESFRERLEKEVLVMSGAMGTMLHQTGADLGGCIGEWILQHPDLYRALVRDYFQAGCDIVSATSFTLNRISLAKYGLAGKTEQLNRGVIGIVKEIQPEGTFITGSLGPTGKMLKPLGDLSPDELFQAYSEQVDYLAAGGVEVINILTMYDLEEAVIALRAARARTSLPVLVSLAYDPAPKGYRTMMGVSPEMAAKRLEAEGADVIGANCGTVTLPQMAEVIGLMKSCCRKPLLAKPNAGSPKVVEGREQYAAGPEQFGQNVGEWVRQGARIVSACCGSSPAHIREIVKKVRPG